MLSIEDIKPIPTQTTIPRLGIPELFAVLVKIGVLES